MKRFARILACTVFALGVGGAAAAQTPSPVPSPAPTPVPTPAAFAAHAHANVTVVAHGQTITGSAQLGIAQRGDLTRVDLLSIKSDAFPIPPLSGSAVIDRRAHTVTVWNDTSKRYYTQPFIPRVVTGASPAPRASAPPRPRASALPRPAVLSPFRDLEVFDVSLRLTGHATTVGIPTTGLAFDLQVKKRGDAAASHVTATTQLADDYAIFPITLDLSIEPGAAPFSAKLAYAVDDLTRGAAVTTSFQVPSGYAKASSIGDVFFPRRR